MKWPFALFRNKILDTVSDISLFKAFGRKSYIRNGVGFGFISDDYLYDNCFIEIGIGRVYSGYGDWGGGLSHTSDSPLKIIVNKDCIIQKVETSSFYNNNESQETEKVAQRYKSKLKLKKLFVIKDEMFKQHVYGILDFIPCKSHIGYDVFESPNMLEICTDPKEKDSQSFRDPVNK